MKQGRENKQEKECPSRQAYILILAIMTFVLCFLWLFQKGSMILWSVDAGETWKTIKSYYDESIYPSYTLYKGFMAVYPYVWFYQLARILQINEFTFVMMYHAFLFTYIAIYGIPNVSGFLLNRKVSLLQRVVLSLILFVLWEPTKALDNLMVDLPSCALFFGACDLVSLIDKGKGEKNIIIVFFAGMLAFLCGNISGQYSISMLCIVCCILVKIIQMFRQDMQKKFLWFACSVMLGLSLLFTQIPKYYFDEKVMTPFEEAGTAIAGADFWLNRGLIYMMNIDRMFYGYMIENDRGYAVVVDVCGDEDKANEILKSAEVGAYIWDIRTYLSVVLKYPLEFINSYLDRLFLCFSNDLMRNSFGGLFLSYYLLYMAITVLVKKLRCVKDVFSLNNLLLLAAISSIIPVLVLTVEMRYALTIQGMFFGIAVIGGSLFKEKERVSVEIETSVENEIQRTKMKERVFPWNMLLGLIFTLLCIAHWSALYGQSLERLSLYKLW